MKTHFDLNTGKMEPGEGDPALGGAHCRPDIEREIDRNMKRIHKEEAASIKAAKAQFKADRMRAKTLALAHWDRMARQVWAAGMAGAHWLGCEVKTLRQAEKWLTSELWFNPTRVIELHAWMEKEGKL